jgi:hypothetical protein
MFALLETLLPDVFRSVYWDILLSVQASVYTTQYLYHLFQMTRQEYCPTVSAFRTHKVAKQKPVPVTIYDYYDSCE